jgi:hypothetical protein
LTVAAIPEASVEMVEAAKEAAVDCALVIYAVFRIAPEKLFKSTRGAAREAFPRQLLMAGLCDGLGFDPLTAGRAVGRDKATVEHARKVVEAFRLESRGGSLDVADVVRMLGVDGVRDYLGGEHLIVEIDRQENVTVISGHEPVAEFLRHCDGFVEDLFKSFQLVAVRGRAYRAELEKASVEAPTR